MSFNYGFKELKISGDNLLQFKRDYGDSYHEVQNALESLGTFLQFYDWSNNSITILPALLSIPEFTEKGRTSNMDILNSYKTILSYVNKGQKIEIWSEGNEDLSVTS